MRPFEKLSALGERFLELQKQAKQFNFEITEIALPSPHVIDFDGKVISIRDGKILDIKIVIKE